METDETVVLRPRRLKTIGLLLLCLGFTAGGIFMIRHGQLMGWFVVGFFGLGILVSASLLLPGCAYLKLSPDGFTMCSFYRSHTYRWSDVEGFGVYYIGPNGWVVLNFSANYQSQKRGRDLSTAMTGYEGAVADGIYGVPLEKLAALMNDYKSRYQEEMAAGQAFQPDESANPTSAAPDELFGA